MCSPSGLTTLQYDVMKPHRCLIRLSPKVQYNVFFCMFLTKRFGVLTRAWFSVGFNFSLQHFRQFLYTFADTLFCQLLLSFQLSNGLCIASLQFVSLSAVKIKRRFCASTSLFATRSLSNHNILLLHAHYKKNYVSYVPRKCQTNRTTANIIMSQRVIEQVINSTMCYTRSR